MSVSHVAMRGVQQHRWVGIMSVSHVAMRVYSNRHVGWDAVGESCSYEGRTARGTDLWVGMLTYRQ